MNGIAPVPGNFTYPTRNFATLGPFVLFRSTITSVDRGALSVTPKALLHIAMQIGLYHPQIDITWGLACSL
jgi:hypothetical protein